MGYRLVKEGAQRFSRSQKSHLRNLQIEKEKFCGEGYSIIVRLTGWFRSDFLEVAKGVH